MAKSKKGVYLIVFVLLLALIAFQGFKFSVFTPPSYSFVSFQGSGHSQFGDEWATDTGGTATIGKYKIEIAKQSDWNILSCKTQADCGGSDSGKKDANGCPIYNIPESTAYSATWKPQGSMYYYCVDPSATLIDTTKCAKTIPATTCSGTIPVIQRGCAFKAKVYYGGQLVENQEWTGETTLTKSYLNGKPASSQESDILIQFNNQRGYNYGDCRWISSYIKIKPTENITVQVATPQSNYFEGQAVNVEVHVTNSGSQTLSGVLNVKYEIPTGLTTPSTQLDTKTVEIKSGLNVFSYTIPTQQSTKQIFITPTLDLFLEPSSISGVVYSDGRSYTPISQIEKIPYGSVTEKTFEVMILPRPMYMQPNPDGSCNAGYSINAAGDYCVDDNLKNLPCYVTAPPKVEGHEYECTSYGIWAETVFKTVWGDCPAGTTPTTTDKGEQICIKTEIAEKFLECNANSNPPAVCSGITAKCVNNKWEFDGTCDVIKEIQTIETVKEVIVEKTIWGTCPADSRTVETDSGEQVCVKTEYKESIKEVPVVKEVTRTEFISTSYVPQWVYGIIIVLIIITVFVILKKRR